MYGQNNGIPVGLRALPSFGIGRQNQLTAIIQSLFWDGSQGWWYDNDDLTTLFQDSSGTTPVTAVEQSVGLQLDKSRGGVGTNGTRRINLLTYTEQFDNAAWGKAAVTVTANATTAPDNTATADLWSNTSTTYPSVFQSSVPVSANTTYVFTVFAKVATHNVVSLELRFASGDDTLSDATYNLTTLAVTTFAAGATATCTDVGNGWRRLTLTRTNPGSGATAIGIIGGSAINSGDVLSTGLTFYIWGADIRLAADANVAPTYQPITATWYDTLPGNHRYQTTSGSRPVWSKRVNRLTKTEQFDDAVWLKSAASVSVTAAPDSTNTAWTITGDGTNAIHSVRQGHTLTGARTFVFIAKAGTNNFLQVFTDGTSNEFANFNLATGAVGSIGSDTSNVLISAYGGGWYSCSATFPVANATTHIRFALITSATAARAETNTLSTSVAVWRPDLRPANQATGLLPLYQRVNTATDYDTNGFPGYLRADGTDDFLQTNSIDFTATDKVTRCVGLRKLATTEGAVVELSANWNTNNGSFYMFAPDNAGIWQYGFGSRGTAAAASNQVAFTTSAAYAAPVTNIATALDDIAGDSTQLRLNGSVIATATGDKGSGNFGNYPAYFFRRGGTTLPFNGEEYANIAVGKLLTADQLTALETYVNGATRAY